MQLPLSFPVFYHTVIKERLSLKQYDAVNILLLGKPFVDCVEYQISQSMAANYVSGKKKINKDYISAFLQLSTSEIKRRLQSLGLQNLDQGVLCLKYMLYKNELIVSESDRSRLLHLVRTDKDQYNFLTEALILAIKCPPQDVLPLTEEERKTISVYQEPMLYGDIDTELSPEQIAESEKHLAHEQKPAKPEIPVVIRNGSDIFKNFDSAIYRTQELTMPDGYEKFRQFFYAFTEAKKDWKLDKELSDFMRPYYERVVIHVITIECLCIFFTPDIFNRYFPQDDFNPLCILVEGEAEDTSFYNADYFHKASPFQNTPVFLRETQIDEKEFIRVSVVLVSGDTR